MKKKKKRRRISLDFLMTASGHEPLGRGGGVFELKITAPSLHLMNKALYLKKKKKFHVIV